MLNSTPQTIAEFVGEYRTFHAALTCFLHCYLRFKARNAIYFSRAVNFFNSLALLINPSLIASRYTLLNACIFATYLVVVYVSSPFILSFCHCLLCNSFNLSFFKKIKKSWFPASKASLFFKNFCQRRELFAFIKRIFNPKNS